MKPFNLTTLILGSCAVLMLGACSSATYHQTYKGAYDLPKSEVDTQTMSHTINFSDGGTTLSDDEKASLENFLTSNGVGYGDDLVLDLTRGDTGTEAKFRTVTDFLKTRGYWIKYVSQSGGVSNTATAVLNVDRYTAVPPDCQAMASASFTPTELAINKSFGCITAYNLAMMVANPQDLIQGQNDSLPWSYAAVRAIQLFRARFGDDHFTMHPQIKNDIKNSPEGQDTNEAK